MNYIPSLKKITDNIYFYIYAVLLFFSPLIYLSGTNEIFEFPKMFFVYSIAHLLLFIFLVELVWQKNKPKMKIIIPVLLLLLSYTLSTIFSSHLYTSVWGYYTRFNDGLLSILAYVIIFYIAIIKLSLFEFERIFRLSLFSVVISGGIGILQHFGIFSQEWGPEPITRVFSTMGQPNWLAQLLGMQLMCVLYYYFSKSDNEDHVVESGSPFWLLIYIIGFSGLWFTYSLSGLLGFLAGIAVLVIYFGRLGVTKRILLKALTVSALTLIVAVTNPGIFYGKVRDVYTDLLKVSEKIVRIEYVHAQAESEINTQVSDPAFIRLHMWNGAIDLFKSSGKIMMIGSGPETFPYVFQKFRPISENYSSEWDYVLNKPHNYYLETLTENGVFGLAVLLVLYIHAFVIAPVKLKVPLAVLIVTNIFGWPVVAVNVLFWFVYAYSVKISERQNL